jgi:hypothetical protein
VICKPLFAMRDFRKGIDSPLSFSLLVFVVSLGLVWGIGLWISSSFQVVTGQRGVQTATYLL